MTVTVDPIAVSAVVDGETVLMGADMQFIRLDAMGGEIWDLLVAGKNIDAVALTLTERYEVDLATATTDVTQFVQHLCDAGLVTLSP